MSPFIIWVEENIVLVLGLALGLSTLCVALGGLGVWRAGRRLIRPPRPIARFAAAVVLAAAGALGVFVSFDGLKTIVPAARAQNEMLDQPAPALEFSLVGGEGAGRLADYRGRVVLVNVWATWCPPCREEMPSLDQLQTEYADEGLVVLHISDEDREIVAGYLEKEPMTTVHGIAQPIPWPEFGRPTTFMVDREGVVRKIFSGARDYAGFERLVQAYL